MTDDQDRGQAKARSNERAEPDAAERIRLERERMERERAARAQVDREEKERELRSRERVFTERMDRDRAPMPSRRVNGWHAKRHWISTGWTAIARRANG